MEPARLRPLAFFEGVADDEVERAASRCEEIRRFAGDHIADRDDYGYHFYVVVEGEVSVRRDGEVLARLGAGDAFGEGALLGETGKRNADVVAESGVRLARMMVWDVTAVIGDCPEVGARIRTRAERFAAH